MENSLKGLIMAAGVIVTCVIVALGFRMLRESKALADTAIVEISDAKKNLEETKYSQYDGLTVSGADVSNLLRKVYSGVNPGEAAEVTISVVNGRKMQSFRDNKMLGEIANPDSDKYIPITGTYYGTVSRDENKVITGLIFTRK